MNNKSGLCQVLVGIFFIFLWNLNLSDLDTLMADCYSDFGPPPKEKPQKAEKKVEKVIVKDLLERFGLHSPQDMAPCKQL